MKESVGSTAGRWAGSLPWGEWEADARKCADALQSVAVININKRGGLAAVEWGRFYEAARELDELIAKQIELLEPQVIIFTCTLEGLPNHIRQGLCDFNAGDCRVQRLGSAVWVEAYHPNQRKIPHKEYYERIRNAIAASHNASTQFITADGIQAGTAGAVRGGT